jgi:hypothetical protein
MDVYLSEEAKSFLKALNMVRGDQDGLLLGHMRGHRFFVEKIFPTQKGFFSSREKFLSLNQHFGDRVIGFFSFNPDERKISKILTPIAQGMLHLSIHTKDDDTLDIQPFRIDFKDQFFLSRIRLKS